MKILLSSKERVLFRKEDFFKDIFKAVIVELFS